MTEIVRKPGKVLFCRFLLAILGVDPAQKPSKIQKMFIRARTTNQQRHCDCNSCIFYADHEYKGREPSNINLSPFVCFLDVYQPSLTSINYARSDKDNLVNDNFGFVTCLFRTENTRVLNLTSNS